MLKRFFNLGVIEAIARALNWSMGLILAMIFDAETYGIIVLFVAIEGLLVGFYLFGLDKVLLRFTHEVDRKYLISRVLKIWLVNSIFVSLLIALVVTFSEEVQESLFGGAAIAEIICLLLIIAAMSYHKFIIAFYRSLESFWGFAFNRLGIQVIRVLSIIIFALLIGKYQAYLFGSLFAVFFLFCNIFILKNTLNASNSTQDKYIDYRSILNFAWPFVPHALSGAVLSYIDRVMLQSMQGLESVGNYGLGYLLGSAIVFVYGVLATFYEPYVYKNVNQPSKVHNMQSVYIYLLLLFASLGGVLVIVGIDFFNDIIGNKGYSNIGEIAKLVLIAHLVHAFYLISNYQLTLAKKTALIALATFTAALINILLNIILIPIYGEIGAAYSTVISFIILAAFSGYKSMIAYKEATLDKSRVLLIIVLLLIIATSWISSSLLIIIQFSMLALICIVYLIRSQTLKLALRE